VLTPRRYDFEGGCYHTTSVTRGRAPAFADPTVASLLLECIRFLSTSGRAYVLAYAVMPDHLHLLVSPRNPATLSDVMRSLKRYATKQINEVTGRKGSLWQQSFYDRAMRDEAHLRATINYIHRNPVVEGLAKDEGDYLFSSAHHDSWSDLEAYFGA
jgi:REP element-mobilizing transposase RayT